MLQVLTYSQSSVRWWWDFERIYIMYVYCCPVQTRNVGWKNQWRLENHRALYAISLQQDLIEIKQTFNQKLLINCKLWNEKKNWIWPNLHSESGNLTFIALVVQYFLPLKNARKEVERPHLFNPNRTIFQQY